MTCRISERSGGDGSRHAGKTAQRGDKADGVWGPAFRLEKNPEKGAESVTHIGKRKT